MTSLCFGRPILNNQSCFDVYVIEPLMDASDNGTVSFSIQISVSLTPSVLLPFHMFCTHFGWITPLDPRKKKLSINCVFLIRFSNKTIKGVFAMGIINLKKKKNGKFVLEKIEAIFLDQSRIRTA